MVVGYGSTGFVMDACRTINGGTASLHRGAVLLYNLRVETKS